MIMSSMAQQQLGRRPNVKSPVIHQDGSVTFNFFDPTATKVSVTGDFDELTSKRLDMTKQENGRPNCTPTVSPLTVNVL